MSLLPPRPIPRYPSLRHEEHWQKILRCSQAMLERLQTDYALPESDEEFQAVVHLLQTLAPGYSRRLH